MITIHLGVLDSPQVTGTAIELVEPGDYPGIRVKIREAIHNGEDFQVYIRHPACNTWFWDLADHPAVVVVNDDPREQLKRKLRVQALPKDLDANPEWILQLNLLSLPAPPARVGDAWLWIVDNKLGPAWLVQTPSFGHLGDLVNWYATLTEQSSKVLRKKKSEIIERWKSRAQGRVRLAYEHFFEKEPNQASLFLACWQNLNSYYNQTLLRWLDEEGCYNPNLEWIALELPPLLLPQSISEKLSAKAEAYWNGKFGQKHVALGEALAKMSGLLLGELRAVRNFVVKTHAPLNIFELEELRVKFSHVEGASQMVDEIATELPPPLPKQPAEGWNATEWMDWARTEYIPYKKWLLDHDRICETTIRQSIMYEEWLYGNYSQFLQSFDLLIYGAFRYIQPLLKEGYVILWVLVDNLPLFWFQTLSRALVESGFMLSEKPENPLYLFSMLPSETSVSRVSSLLGQLPNQIESKNFEVYFGEQWQNRGASNVTISTSIDELCEQSAKGANLHLLIYTSLDSLAHLPDHEVDDRESEIAFRLGSLANRLGEVLKNLSEIQKTKLVISTDHGSTKMLPNAGSLDLPASAKLDDVFEQHRRFIRVGSFDALNSYEWFFLEANKFSLGDNYAVAKGDRYIGARPTGYTHGGLSPEETMVALSVWEQAQIPQDVNLVLSHTSQPILRGRPQKISITVRNPFSYPIRNVVVVFPKFGVHLGAAAIPSRTETALGPSEIQLPARFAVREGIAYVDISVSYEVAGSTRHQVEKLPIYIRELFRTELDDFDKMF